VDQLRVAIAGTGFIGRVHARSARLAGGHLVGVAASAPERAQLAATELGAERAFESAEELVVADDVDVVHLATPNHLHAPLAEAAIAAGKHVVCEKPLGTDVASAARLVTAAGERGITATVPFVYRYHPIVRDLRARVARGELGDLRLLHGGYLQDWMSTPADYGWRVDAALGGRSRAFADIGSHWCDLVEFASGHRIVRLTARTSTLVPERLDGGQRAAFTDGDGTGTPVRVTTEDTASVLFETDRGAVGSAVISQVSPGRKNALWFSLDGALAGAVFEQERPDRLWLGAREESREIVRDLGNLSADAARLSRLPAGHPMGYQDCFDAFVADSYAAIAGDVPEGLPRFADGRRAADLTAAVLTASAEERWVAIDPPTDRVAIDPPTDRVETAATEDEDTP
jgi:predicted dehydrogenase